LTATEQTLAALPLLGTSIAQGGHALAVLTGQDPAALDRRLAVQQPLPQAAPGLALNLPAETLRQRADVRAAEHRLAAEMARLAQADAARLPSFRLGGSLGLTALSLGALGGGTPVVGSLLAAVTLPLFDGGALRAQVQAQQAVLDQSAAAYRSTVLTALQEVEDALVALRGDEQRVQRLQAAARSAGNAAVMAGQRYRSGLVDFQIVLDTQRSQLATQESLAGARADVGTDHVRLFKALGGGWRAEAAVVSP
jgi:NodT family efflux transporter outer membrane factor (OMF) lipoprotein